MWNRNAPGANLDSDELPPAPQDIPDPPRTRSPGATRRSPCRTPFRARHAARAALPGRHRARRVRHGLLLGRRAQLLGGARRVHDRRRLRGRASRPIPPTRRSARGAPATTRSCSWCSGRPCSPTRSCCGSSGRATIPPRACARATTSARSTAPGIYTDSEAQRRGAAALARRLRASDSRRRPRRDHHRDRPRARVLLRRGLPPAVPGEEPRRVLRHRRHGRVLPGRRGRRLARRAGQQAAHRPHAVVRVLGPAVGIGIPPRPRRARRRPPAPRRRPPWPAPRPSPGRWGSAPAPRCSGCGLELPLLAQLAGQGLGRAFTQVHGSAGPKRPAARPVETQPAATAGRPAAVLGAHDAERGEAVAGVGVQQPQCPA